MIFIKSLTIILVQIFRHYIRILLLLPPLGDILFKYQSGLKCRSNCFFNRLVDDWNSLPSFTVYLLL